MDFNSVNYTNQVFYTLLSLNNQLSYTTTVNLGGLNLLLEIGYNSRLKRRWISAKSTAGDVLLTRTFLTLNSAIDFNINTDIIGRKVTLLFDSWDKLPPDFDFINWNDLCVIQFTHYSVDLETATEDILNSYILNTLTFE